MPRYVMHPLPLPPNKIVGAPATHPIVLHLHHDRVPVNLLADFFLLYVAISTQLF